MKRPDDMRCLMVVEDWPLSRDSPGGAAALNLSHLELLADTVEAVDLLVLGEPRSSKGFADWRQERPDEWRAVEERCTSWRFLELRPRPGEVAPWRHLRRGLSDPSRLLIDLEAESERALLQIVRELEPDLIWAEHLVPAALVDRLLPDARWVYSHHDWNWRIKRHRAGTRFDLKRLLRTLLRRRYEEALVRRATGCVSGSVTEAAAIRRLGAEAVAHLPASFEPAVSEAALDALENGAGGTPRLVHLGGLRTTATRLGLERFLTRAWPGLVARRGKAPEFWVIGDLDGASPALRRQLDEAGAVCPGFVADLRTVLRPGDLHVLPWEHDTGTRTRVPLVLSHAQVLVAVRDGVACLGELRNGENCVLVDSVDELAPLLDRLLDDRAERLRLARQGLATLRRRFTRQALLPLLHEFLQEL